MAKYCLLSVLLTQLFLSVNAQSTPLNTQKDTESADLFGTKKDSAHKKRQNLELITLMLAKQIKRSQHITPQKNSSSQFIELIETAKSRHTLISELLELSPKAVKQSALPQKIAKYAPDEIKQYILQKQKFEGVLEVFYEDYEQVELSQLRYVLTTDTGRVELHFLNAKSLQNLKHGVKIKVNGLFIAGSDAIDSAAAIIESQADIALLEDGGSTLALSSVAPAPLENTLGEQKTLVLLVNFQDNPNEQPWTIDQVQQMVFGTVNDYYQEASYGQTWLAGDVMGYLTLPINSLCDYGTIDSYAQIEANNNGIDVSSYDRLVYLFPKNNDCGWRGQGTIAGSPSRAWLNGELNLLTIGHEIGHNMGLHHAKYIGCGTSEIDDTCISLEYGDNLDVMGKSTGHFNAFNKERLGWLNSDVGQIITSDSDGTFLLEPYESAHAGSAKSLKVLRSTDSRNGNDLWYYLEYRQAIGFDSFLEDKAGITNGVLLHLNIESDLQSSQLIDMTPNSTRYDLDDAALVVGKSYTDINAGVVITTEWADQTGISVNVVSSGQSCIKAAPSLSLSPNESVWVEAGTPVTYSALVTNNDSSGCAVSSYDISAAVPIGWSSSNDSLSLEAGANGKVLITITSAVSSVNGFYDITFSAQNNNDRSYNSSNIVSYVVDNPTEACVSNNPSFTLSINNSGELLAGDSATYRGIITNQDSESCSNSDFDVSANVPIGWTTENITTHLAPGQSSDIILSVLSPNTAADGIYDFNINAKRHSDSTYSSNDVASYTISTPLPNCVASAPLIVIANQQSEEVSPGTMVNYTAIITNQDSSDCSATTFDVIADVPTGWSAIEISVNLQPKASTDVKISIRSDLTAVKGDHNIVINAQSSVDINLSNNVSVSYKVKASINEAPVAFDDSVTMVNKNAIIVDVMANDNDPENDTLNVVSVSQGAKGSVEITSTGKVIYTPAKSFKTSDSFSYTISDGDKMATATVSLSLTSSGSGNKGKGKK